MQETGRTKMVNTFIFRLDPKMDLMGGDGVKRRVSTLHRQIHYPSHALI